MNGCSGGIAGPQMEAAPAAPVSPRAAPVDLIPTPPSPSRTPRVRQPLVDARHLGHPPRSLLVVELHDLLVGPGDVVRQVRHLLVQPVRGVARHSPGPSGVGSTSNSPSQCGHATRSRAWPAVLIRM